MWGSSMLPLSRIPAEEWIVPVLALLLGLALSLPLPLTAWWVCSRRRTSRSTLMLAVFVSSITSYFTCVATYLGTRPEPGPYQHAQLSGLDAFLAWTVLGICHAIALAVVGVLAWRSHAARTARGGRA